MNNYNNATRHITTGALIAAAYVTLTQLFAPISFGPIQVRIAEALTILPMFTPAAVPGLFIGCLRGNLHVKALIWDVFFGSFATLIGAWGTWMLRHRRWLAPVPTVLANAAIIPPVLRWSCGLELPLPLMAACIAVGEVVGCYILGELLAEVMLRRSVFRKMQEDE